MPLSPNKLWCRISLRFFLFIIALLCLLIPGQAGAHPHVFADASYTLVFDQEGLAGLKVRWVLDDMFSAMMVEEFDTNTNGELDESEKAEIRKAGSATLKDFSYFTHIKINGRKFDIKWVKNFKVEFRDFQLVYDFEIPCHVKAVNSDKTVTIGVYDHTYYTDLALTGTKPVKVQAPPLIKAAYEVGRDEDNKIYFDQVSPLVIKVLFRRVS